MKELRRSTVVLTLINQQYFETQPKIKMRQGGEPQGVQIVRQGEPTPYHCNFNRLYCEISG